MQKTKLTIAVTTFNRWELCLKALESVCGQEGVDKEVVLVDDCSTEPMPDKVQDSVQANGVVHIRHETNKGLAAARNSAIAAAKGKYFSFCDDDDQWPAGMAAGLVEAMEQGPEGVGMGVALPNSSAGACGEVFKNYPRLSSLMLRGFTPPVGSQIYRLELVREVGGYTPEVKSGVDHDLWISLAGKDPRVAVAWGFAATIGADPERSRLTTDEACRRESIAASLQTWKPRIIEVFGPCFYSHFLLSYQQYLDYKFFYLDLHSGHWLRALRRAINPLVLRKLARRVADKILSRPRGNLFPPYCRQCGITIPPKDTP